MIAETGGVAGAAAETGVACFSVFVCFLAFVVFWVLTEPAPRDVGEEEKQCPRVVVYTIIVPLYTVSQQFTRKSVLAAHHPSR